MAMTCKVCNHPQRLSIDRDLVQGHGYQKIGNTYGVSWQSVRNHAQGHLSRQLTQAYEKKSEAWAMDLLDHLRSIVDKAEAIFDRNYDKNTTTSDIVALNALREQRGTFELLAKIIAYSQTKAMEQQVQEQQARKIDLSDFSKEELLTLYKLGLKQTSDDLGLELLPEPAAEPIIQPIVTVLTRLSAPPPPLITPIPEIEPEPEAPKTLPPRPTKLIPGWDDSCLRRPY